jgi:hypothetical protein
VTEQAHPQSKPKVQRRTVYFREATDVEIHEHPEEPPERRYSARPVDLPECTGWGFTQEGASMEAERKLREAMGRRFREGGRHG